MPIPIKNTTGWVTGGQMINATTGAAFSGTVTVNISLDGATETVGSVGSGLCTSAGNGYFVYFPSQAETNATTIGFTFTGLGAVPQTVQIPTVPA